MQIYSLTDRYEHGPGKLPGSEAAIARKTFLRSVGLQTEQHWRLRARVDALEVGQVRQIHVPSALGLVTRHAQIDELWRLLGRQWHWHVAVRTRLGLVGARLRLLLSLVHLPLRRRLAMQSLGWLLLLLNLLLLDGMDGWLRRRFRFQHRRRAFGSRTAVSRARVAVRRVAQALGRAVYRYKKRRRQG